MVEFASKLHNPPNLTKIYRQFYNSTRHDTLQNSKKWQ